MASFKNATLRSNDVATDMPRTDLCKELNTIFKDNKAQQGTGTSLGAETRPLIQKVPRILRDNEKNKSNYDPRLVSIGPYNHGDPKLELGQTLKTRLVQQFASYVTKNKPAGKSKSLEAYFQSDDFSKVIREARNCYAKDSTALLDEEAFKCLMFLDGCFLVYFIHCIVNNFKDLQMKYNHIAIIITDLFLLENQLPYTILQELVTEFIPSKADKDRDDDIKKFINMQGEATGTEARGTPLYQFVLDNRLFKKKDRDPRRGTSSSSLKREPFHLLDFLRTKFLDTSESSSQSGNWEDRNHSDYTDWQSFRSVDELKAAGITCVASGSSCVKTIKFQSYRLVMYASLSLPAIVIDDSFKTKWLNLAAYEACPDFLNDGEITSFLCFMDSLIDRPEDVKELRQQGILQNFLGSDKQVAELFNELATDLTPNPDEYQQVKHHIQMHFNKKSAIWMAEALHTHFTSPWTVLAFLAAVLALVLTGIQTYLTAFPPK